MLQRLMYVGLCAAAYAVCGQVSPVCAQVIPKGQYPNNIKELQEQFEQLQKALEQNQQDVFGAGRRGNAAQLRWGGLRVTKADAALQEKLGLPETDGMVVMAVDPNSVADKAGLKANDVLVTINSKTVPNDIIAFANLVKEQKPNEAFEIVVVRDGKEETIKGAAMPQAIQAMPGFGGLRGGQPFPFPRAPFNPGGRRVQEMNVNGVKISRRQDGDQFAGEYSADDLHISVHGKIENGTAKIDEITVQEGKETKKYTNIRDVPAQHRAAVQQLVPVLVERLRVLPLIPPGLERK